jgi:hypothetical protein
MKYYLLAWAFFYSSISWSQQKRTEAPTFKMFPEILVKPLQGVMRISRDTIEFKVADEIDPSIVSIEDLFKQYQGFYVTEEGKIFYNGSEVSVLMVDGDPISVFDYRQVASNLRASMIKSIEVIPRYSANRMEGNDWIKNGLAVNLKMKKEYVKKLSTDLLFALSSRKGLLGKLDLVRMGVSHKSITWIEQNLRARRKYLERASVSQESATGLHFLEWRHHEMLRPTYSLLRNYLPNNTTLQTNTVHSFSLGSFHKLHVDAGMNRFAENVSYCQETTMKLSNHSIWHQRRASNLFKNGTHQTLQLLYVHDRFKNNRGEYRLLLSNGQHEQILHDSIFIERWWVNKGKESGRSFSIVLFGKEQIALKHNYVLEVKWNLAENRIGRNIATTTYGSSDFNIKQQFISTDINLSHSFKKSIYRTGARYFYEKRESIIAFLKEYIYAEYQYLVSKKIILQQDLAVGRGSYIQQPYQAKKPIYQIDGKLIYNKAIFNQYYLGFYVAQKIPVIDVLVTRPLVDISGFKQYADLAHLFQQVKRIELGRNRNDLYRGFQYGYQITYSKIENNAHHSIGLDDFSFIDTVRFRGTSSNIQLNGNADQLIFPIHLRCSFLYQHTTSMYQQSINGQLQDLYLQTSLLKLGIKSTGDHSVQYEFYGSLQHNSSCSSIIRSNYLQLLLKYKWGKNIFIGFQSYRYNQFTQRSYYFTNLLINTSIHPTLKLNFACINIFNILNYQQHYVGPNGLQTTTTRLGGRTIQVEAKWAL